MFTAERIRLEASPGNYILREISSGLELIWHDADGAEALLWQVRLEDETVPYYMVNQHPEMTPRPNIRLPQPINRSSRIKWLALFLLLLGLVPFILLLVSFRSPSFPVPDPNGYDDFIQAADLLTGSLHGAHPDDRQSLKQYVSENADAFALVKAGLEKSSRVPVQLSAEWGTAHVDEIARLKKLTHALIAKGRLAELDGRAPEALEAYLEAYRFAHEMSAGGLAMHFLNGISCKALVLDRLKPLIPNLNRSQRDELLGLIDSLESQAEDARVVHSRTRQWQQGTFGPRMWRDRWMETLKEIRQSRSLKPIGSSRRILVSRQELYLKQYIEPMRESLEPSGE